MTDRPTWEPFWLACKACGHEWDDWQPSHVVIATWVAHVETYRCPKCGMGIRHLLLKTKPIAAGFTDE